ncbi:Uncharacterised protein [Streptococcus uberis]|nr:Uncharacterised protein [Streptococcus uberis]
MKLLILGGNGFLGQELIHSAIKKITMSLIYQDILEMALFFHIQK